jgi:transcriptional regulator with XRE-family HTH domain
VRVEVDPGSVKRLRLESRLSRRVLAEAAGVHAETVARIERGALAPRLGTIYSLAAALHVSPDAISKLVG